MKKIDVANYSKPSKFIKWEQGDNHIRILSEPYLYQVVGKKTAKGYVRQVLEDNVAVAEFLKDAPPKLTYGFVAYHFEANKFVVIETGIMLGDQLTKLIQSKYPDEYKAHDIIVHVKGENLRREYSSEFAKESSALPEGVTKDSAEFRFILSYFEGL